MTIFRNIEANPIRAGIVDRVDITRGVTRRGMVFRLRKVTGPGSAIE